MQLVEVVWETPIWIPFEGLIKDGNYIHAPAQFIDPDSNYIPPVLCDRVFIDCNGIMRAKQIHA